ncbi:MAG TPA: glycosyltransferase [Alphaproteobacteria bacterium]
MPARACKLFELSIRITVAIPTHNRASTLRETLASVAAQRVSAEVELDCLVVDNNSTDDTAAAVDSFRATSPLTVRRVFETGAGSSFARNRAVRETDADFVFFLDDDAIAEPNWADEMLAELQRRTLDAACGMVVPKWTVAPPRWLGPKLWVKLAVHDRNLIECEPLERAEVHSNYFSANVGFRRETFERFGMFREDLGVVGGNPISGEDTELFQRIIARRGAIGFARGAIVHHQIGAERMTRNYLLRKSFAYGIGSAITAGASHNGLDKLVRNAMRMTAAAIRGDAETAIYHELECANFLGYWRGKLMRR